VTRILLSVVLLALVAAPASAKLEIDKIEASHGRLGPLRKNLDFYPYDEVVVRFLVTGAKSDEGQVDIDLSWQLLDSANKVVLDKKVASKGHLAFGSESFPASVAVLLTEPATAGEYTLKVTVADHLGGESARFERTLNLKATEFAIVSPKFSYDEAGMVPAPAGGVLGQALHFKVFTVGFDRSQGKLDNEMTVQVLDRAGKELLPKPLRVTAEKDDAKLVKELPVLDFSGFLVLTKTGEFTLKITVTDRNSRKTATFETPLKVTTP
jgi:hypothetical protein